MDHWQPLRETLAATRQRYSTRPPSARPSDHPLLAHVPELAGLPTAALDRLGCPVCGGTGHRPDHPEIACQPLRDGDPRACFGTGLCCPVCRTAGWVADRRFPLDDARRYPPCPGCMSLHTLSNRHVLDKDKRAATIVAYVAEAWAALEQQEAA